MPGGVTFRLDRREFDRTLNEYRKYSKRDVATIVNTKAFYIARGATRKTPKASQAKMDRQLLKNIVTGIKVVAWMVKTLKSGKERRTAWLKRKTTAPLAALIINCGDRLCGRLLMPCFPCVILRLHF